MGYDEYDAFLLDIVLLLLVSLEKLIVLYVSILQGLHCLSLSYAPLAMSIGILEYGVGHKLVVLARQVHLSSFCLLQTLVC